MIHSRATWMNLKIITLSERNQTQKEYTLYDSIFIKFRKMQTNL